MAFTVQDYHDLVKLLAAQPEWQADLRRLLLSEDFLALPSIVRELAEAQKRTEQRLERLEAVVQELAECQKRMGDDVSKLKGYFLEDRYASKAYAYFGR